MSDRMCTQCCIRPATARTGTARCAECRQANARAGEALRYARRREGLPRRGDIVTATCRDCGTSFEHEVTTRVRAVCDACVIRNQREAVVAWNGRNPERGKAIQLRAQEKRRRTRHNLPLDTVWPAGCDICGAVTELHVDHDHACCPGKYSCGKCVGGFLCNNCNNGLGRFKDDCTLLRKAADYAERTRGIRIADLIARLVDEHPAELAAALARRSDM